MDVIVIDVILKTDGFIDFISQRLDQKIADHKISFPFAGVKPKELQSSRVAFDKCKLDESKLSPEQYQIVIQQAQTFKQRTEKVFKCSSPEAIEMYAKGILKKKFKDDYSFWDKLKGITAKEKLLNHVFKELIHESSKEEINAIAEKYCETIPPVEQTANKAKIIAQQCLDRLSKFFGSNWVKIPLKVLNIPFKIGKTVFFGTFTASNYAQILLEQGRDEVERSRLEKELSAAQKLWANQVANYIADENNESSNKGCLKIRTLG